VKGSRGRRAIVTLERIDRAILLLRGQKVMLDSDLAALYGVATKSLNQAVRRNAERFPLDFMFQLTVEEVRLLRSQTVTLKPGRGLHRKYQPYAFTEQGVAMLSSVLRSPRAVRVNVEIVRAFVRLRRMLESNTELSRKLDALEAKYDGQFKIVFEAIRELMLPPERVRRRIGFGTGNTLSSGRPGPGSCLDLAGDLQGALEGPVDLSSNAEHHKRYGRRT
jgi:hypothetical protein